MEEDCHGTGRELMAEVVLEARRLSRSIGGRRILHNLGFELHQGRVLAIMGPNGAGKSTLLKILAGSVGYDGGDLYQFGNRISTLGSGDRRIGYLAHQSFLYLGLSLRENLRFYGRLWHLTELEMRIDRVLAEVDLLWCHDDPVRTYSRGMRQRAALARMLLPGPELMLLDEPFTGLDGEGRHVVTRLLRDQVIMRGTSIVLITHDNEDTCWADGTAILAHGRFVWWARQADLVRGVPNGVYTQYVHESGTVHA